MAKKETIEEADVMEGTAAVAEVDPMEQKTTIRLPKTRELKEDVFVGINGRTWLIQRGVSVEVPVAVAEVLAHSEKMQQLAMEYETQAAAPLEQMMSK